MEKARILFVEQEVTPYLKETPMGKIGRHLPQGIQERGKEIRTFMPRYGCINERRNQLHEVIRLSGMNLIINDTDHPLIIKVASIQAARMQVYFIDNEDFFQRKSIFKDKEDNFFSDNDERAVFFCRGVIETVNKLGWAPSLVHCHGWFSSFVPIYLKKAFCDNPMFANTRVVLSVYDDEFNEKLSENLTDIVKVDGLSKEDLKKYAKTNYVDIMKTAINYCDGVIIGSENINAELENYIKNEINIPFLEYKNEDNYVDAYNEFYDEILVNEPILS
jgi:starch synthase